MVQSICPLYTKCLHWTLCSHSFGKVNDSAAYSVTFANESIKDILDTKTTLF